MAAVALVVAAAALVPSLANKIAYAVESGKAEANRAQLAELSKGDTLSPLFRAVSKALKPAVVEVRVTQRTAAQAVPPEMEEFLRQFGRGAPQMPREQIRRGLGSGVIVDAKNGYVLTNYHVVGGADEVEVVLADNRSFQAEWVRTDRQTDLAIVKIKADNLVADAPLGDSDAMEVGDLVLAIGSPEGLPQTVTSGIISAKGRTGVSPAGGANSYQDFLQTDAAINQGNSGGPLVNMKGEVVGVNTAIISHMGVGGNEGIGFAIPSNMVRRVMDQLIENGKVLRGYLGVGIQDVDDPLARSLGLPGTKGALITEVQAGSPAEKAGLKVKDFVVSLDGKPVSSRNQFRNEIAGIKPESTISLDLFRDGKKITVQAKTGSLPAELAGSVGEETPKARSEAAVKLGLRVATMTDELAQQYGYKPGTQGVVITQVEPASDAAGKGLVGGMVVVEVQNKKVATAEEFNKIVSGRNARSGVQMLVRDSQGRQEFLFISPTHKKADSGGEEGE
jgi:serine protease Do